MVQALLILMGHLRRNRDKELEALRKSIYIDTDGESDAPSRGLCGILDIIMVDADGHNSHSS